MLQPHSPSSPIEYLKRIRTATEESPATMLIGKIGKHFVVGVDLHDLNHPMLEKLPFKLGTPRPDGFPIGASLREKKKGKVFLGEDGTFYVKEANAPSAIFNKAFARYCKMLKHPVKMRLKAFNEEDDRRLGAEILPGSADAELLAEPHDPEFEVDDGTSDEPAATTASEPAPDDDSGGRALTKDEEDRIAALIAASDLSDELKQRMKEKIEDGLTTAKTVSPPLDSAGIDIALHHVGFALAMRATNAETGIPDDVGDLVDKVAEGIAKASGGLNDAFITEQIVALLKSKVDPNAYDLSEATSNRITLMIAPHVHKDMKSDPSELDRLRDTFRKVPASKAVQLLMLEAFRIDGDGLATEGQTADDAIRSMKQDVKLARTILKNKIGIARALLRHGYEDGSFEAITDAFATIVTNDIGKRLRAIPGRTGNRGKAAAAARDEIGSVRGRMNDPTLAAFESLVPEGQSVRWALGKAIATAEGALAALTRSEGRDARAA